MVFVIIISFLKYINENELFGFGKNERSQLGILKGKQNYPVKEALVIEFNFNSSLKDIACGNAHILFLTLRGTVYSCGQLGLPMKTSKLKPKFRGGSNIPKLTEFHKIIQIGCGYQSNYVLDEYGQLYTFGDNLKAVGVKKNIAGMVHTVPKIKFCKISNGMSHFAGISVDKCVYTFGVNELFCQYVRNML